MKPTLRYEKSAQHIYDKLKEIPRTGWVMRGVQSPETVYDHTVSLLALSISLREQLNLNDSEFDDLLHILEVHDWAEAVAGDEFIPNDDQQDYEARKQAKAERELSALHNLLEGQTYKDIVLQLFDRYETGGDRVAKLAKELDKYQALELALEYEEQQGIPLFTEFCEYYERDWPFSHPVLLERINQLQEKHGALSQK